MAEAEVEVTISASAADVWDSVSDFGGLHKIHPAVEATVSAGKGLGAKRILRLKDGGICVEKLLHYDEQERSLTYTVLESPFPFKEYVSTMAVLPQGDGACAFKWSATFEAVGVPEGSVKAAIEDFYMGAAENLRTMFDG